MTHWYKGKLHFTSKRVEFISRKEQLSISYKDIGNINISPLRRRPPKAGHTMLWAGLGGILGLITIYQGFETLAAILIITSSLMFLNAVFLKWVKSYNLSLGQQMMFSIKKNDKLIKRIKDAYEKGKNFK